MVVHSLLAVLTLACVVSPARAQIFECVDPNGNKRFTNIASEAKGCKVLNVGPFPSAPAAPAPAPAAPPPVNSRATIKPPPVTTPSSFPRVDRDLQRQRDNDRRRILETELDHEEKLLAQARRELAEQESMRLGSERNYQRTLDRLEPYQRRVRLHEDNVANLRKEISKIR